MRTSSDAQSVRPVFVVRRPRSQRRPRAKLGNQAHAGKLELHCRCLQRWGPLQDSFSMRRGTAPVICRGPSFFAIRLQQANRAIRALRSSLVGFSRLQVSPARPGNFKPATGLIPARSIVVPHSRPQTQEARRPGADRRASSSCCTTCLPRLSARGAAGLPGRPSIQACAALASGVSQQRFH